MLTSRVSGYNVNKKSKMKSCFNDFFRNFSFNNMYGILHRIAIIGTAKSYSLEICVQPLSSWFRQYGIRQEQNNSTVVDFLQQRNIFPLKLIFREKNRLSSYQRPLKVIQESFNFLEIFIGSRDVLKVSVTMRNYDVMNYNQ